MRTALSNWRTYSRQGVSSLLAAGSARATVFSARVTSALVRVSRAAVSGNTGSALASSSAAALAAVS